MNTATTNTEIAESIEISDVTLCIKDDGHCLQTAVSPPYRERPATIHRALGKVHTYEQLLN